jgi:CRP/FNR family transcriptional regulator, cyclic AMP receptor protein
MPVVSPVRPLPANLEALGDATGYADRIFGMLDKIELFEDFERDEIRLLAGFMRAYRALPGTEIIREGDGGDYMLLMIEGEVDIYKNDHLGLRKRIAIVGAGKTIGEMSMIDGEPRFSTCLAATPLVFSVLTRDDLTRIITEQPLLGAKILMEMVVMLSQRLRQTGVKLVELMEK